VSVNKQAVDLTPGDVITLTHPEKETISALVMGSSGTEFDTQVILTTTTFDGERIEIIATPDQEVAVA